MKHQVLLRLGVAIMLAAMAMSALGQGQVQNYRPVTDDVLVGAGDNPNDWLMWRRTYNGWGFSPLDQINPSNVANLQVAWAWTMAPGAQESTPLVHDGVMYLAQPGDVVHALDARTGDLIWSYTRELPDIAWGIYSANRGPALYEDKLILATADAYLVALDAATGQVAWEYQVADYQLGFRYTGGPLVIDGVVVAGMSGCTNRTPGGCFISGHSVQSGEELWRVQTTAGPGETGGDTWDDLPDESRHGGSAWITGSYDPELNLVYWGVAQPIPWVRELRGSESSNLYTNSTLAINPQTGELVWYYQYNPGDTWDLDEHYEQILIDTEVNGQLRQLLVRAGKRGILWALDRTNGEFVYAKETVFQNTIAVDPVTGAVTENSDLIPGIGAPVLQCPHLLGGKDWQAMAYNPNLGTIYIPLNNTCAMFESLDIDPAVGQSFGAGRSVPQLAPGKDLVGRVDAVNVGTQATVWSHEQRAGWTGALVATGGGLVFGGDENRRFKAFDGVTGEVLWEVPLNTAVIGYPISYAVDGVQYVAVTVGGGTALSFRALTPEIVLPSGGNQLWVFSLPRR